MDQILEQAKHVASIPPKELDILENIFRSLEQAISARRRCTRWVQAIRSPSVSEHESTPKLKRFTDILEDVLNLLRRARKDLPNEESQKPSPSSHRERTRSPTPKAPYNRFHHLHVEESQLTTYDETLTTDEADDMSQNMQLENMVMETPEGDVLLAVHCMLTDLKCTRGFIEDTWDRHKSVKISIRKNHRAGLP